MILSIIEFAFRGLLMVVLFFVLKILSKVIGDFFNLSFYTLAVDCILLCSVIALFLKPFLSLSKGIVSYLKEFTSQFLIAGAIIASTYFLSSYFEPNFSYRFVPINGRDMFKLFLFFFLVSVSEELFFRKIVIHFFRVKFSPQVSLLASALIFTILHLFNSKVEVIAVMNIFCGGWVLGLLYLQNKTIVSPIGFHLGWNLTQAIVGSPVSGESNFNSSDYMTDLFSGNSFGLESSITCLLLLLIYLLFLIRKHVILQKN